MSNHESKSYRELLNLGRGEFALLMTAAAVVFVGAAMAVFLIVQIVSPSVALGPVRPYALGGLAAMLVGGLGMGLLLMRGHRRRIASAARIGDQDA